MTREEEIVLSAFRDIYNNKDRANMDSFYAIDQVITEWREQRERSNTYRWHDLRKNPEDLPENTGVYLVKRPTDRWTYCEYTVFVYNTKLWIEQSVVAWREIEPFEE